MAVDGIQRHGDVVAQLFCGCGAADGNARAALGFSACTLMANGTAYAIASINGR